MIAKATPIKKVAALWKQLSILATWMQDKYIKWKGLQDIMIKPSIDFAQWKEIVASKGLVNQCIECRAGNTNIWKVGNRKKYLSAIIEAIRTKGQKNTIANGIWSHMPSKLSIILWRIKNKQLKTLVMLNAWGLWTGG